MRNFINKSEEQVADMIIDLYMEKHPRTEKYAVTLASTEDDSEITYYQPLTEEEKKVIADINSDIEEDEYLEEYLVCEEGGQEIIDKMLDVNSPFQLDILKSCDLNDMQKFSIVKINVKDEGDTTKRMYASTMLSDIEFRQMMKLYIMNQNRMSVNMLTYLMPEFTQKMMGHIVETYNYGVYDFYKPFSVEMTEVSEAVDAIMNPMKNELGLFDSQDDAIRQFMQRYAIVPCAFELYDERENCFYFRVYAYFQGNKLHVGHEKQNWPQYSFYADIPDEASLIVDATVLCKHLQLSNYDELCEYLKENFNKYSAVNDLRKFLAVNSQETIIEYK